MSLRTLIKALDRERFEPIIACYGRGELPDTFKEAGIEVHVFERRGLLSSFTIILRLAALIKARDVRLMHVNTLDIRAGLAARLLAVPLVGHLRVIFPFSWVDRLFVRLSDRVVSVSDAVRDHFCARHKGLAGKFTTVPNAVALERDTGRAELRAELNIDSDAQVVAAVGRIDPWKGFEFFVRMAGMVKRDNTRARFVLAGAVDPDDPESVDYDKELRSIVGELQISEEFFFLGYRRDALSVIRQSDVLVVPSVLLKSSRGLRTEGFGRVVIEAMALGTPVVAAAVGGIPEIIQDGVSGKLVEHSDAAALAADVNSILNDANLHNRLREGGRQRFQEMYRADVHACAVQDLYESLLGGSRPGRKT